MFNSMLTVITFVEENGKDKDSMLAN